MKSLLLIFLLALTGFQVNAAVFNGYARVTGITGTTLTVGSVNQANHDFIVGEYVVIMQMQDDVIGANTTNSTTFGNLSAIGSAGLYEIREIIAINGNSTLGFSSGSLSSIELNTLTNTYNTGSNERVQVVTFRQLSADDYTTSANINAISWNGQRGGVVAIYVPGTLTLDHDISVDADGFRGGSTSKNSGGPVCSGASVTRYRENNAGLGFKGEGIYRSTDDLHNNGRAKILNGGGGGSDHNGGGAGGGNYTEGGAGGVGYNNCVTNPSGGFGGISLAGSISGDRIFMGGGGGGGQQNNSQGRDGGNGGGIILIKAEEIVTGTCGGRSISANGAGPSTNGTNDGGGGGGAGGSIVFWVDNWSISPSCELTISANGGDGSTSNTGAPHAGGGAGGQGIVIFNAAEPTANIITETNNGTAGCNDSSVPCSNQAGSASGVNGGGIFGNTGNPLPIELISFEVRKIDGDIAQITWVTASELNNDFFTLYHAVDGQNWVPITQIMGAGNSVKELNYEFLHRKMNVGENYYRLKQTDFDGSFSYSETRLILNDAQSDEVLLFPNPFTDHLKIISPYPIIEVQITNMNGQIVYFSNAVETGILQLEKLNPGVYCVQVIGKYTISQHMIIKQ